MPEGGDAAGIAAMADTVFSGLFEKIMDDGDIDQFEIGNRRAPDKVQKKIDVGGVSLDGVFG
ncbi:hypothetical protein HNQ81_000834 [Desulfoprunum benzoelyticum]|uniref:Uncharacterized protein n=1 Tax=Desulfoprunum benzoelyticum TaxID=1506996 RepID=A0A840UUP6_9BACT|nr:hypothetical protein [Desulfoprunum benzoelyticum]